MFPDGTGGVEFGEAQSVAQRLGAEGAAPQTFTAPSPATETPGQPADLPMGPPGLTGLTPGAAAVDYGELTAIGGARTGYSVDSDPTAPGSLLAMQESLALAKSGGVPVTCPGCGDEQSYKHKDQTCSHCGVKLKPEYGAADDSSSPSMSGGLALPSAIPGETFSLNLADSDPSDEDVTAVGDEGHDAKSPNGVVCPECGKLNLPGAKVCANCAYSLESPPVVTPPAATVGGKVLTAEQQTFDQFILHLSTEQVEQMATGGGLDLAPAQGQRMAWAKKGLARPDGSWPIPDAGYLKKAIQAFPGRAKGQEGAIKAWILKRAKALNYSGDDLKRVSSYGSGVNASMWEQLTGRELSNDAAHMVVLEALRLDSVTGDGGLIWKVLCKTGTLALSPGPGQQDTEKPLNLTAPMFQAVKLAYDDKAFEHVTIPETHANNTLENTGTVDALDVLDKAQALADVRLSQATKDSFQADPDDTLYMLGGLRFTDSKVREKVQEGSILNCSVGLKFNFRRKRDGKLYPVALEHTALTNQPWVDGLGAFGGQTLSAPVFDQEALPVWEGVFTPVERSSDTQDAGTSSQASLSASTQTDELPPTMEPNETTTTPAAGEQTLEQVLASQQARIEQLVAEATERDQRLLSSQTTLVEQGRSLHLSRTDARVAELQKMGVPPAVLTRYKDLRLAAYDAETSGEALHLSIKEGDNTVDKKLDPIAQAEYLMAAMPLATGTDNVYEMTRAIGAETLTLAQAQTERAELTVAQKADQVEKQTHPERFDDEGKRISVADRTGGKAA